MVKPQKLQKRSFFLELTIWLYAPAIRALKKQIENDPELGKYRQEFYDNLKNLNKILDNNKKKFGY